MASATASRALIATVPGSGRSLGAILDLSWRCTTPSAAALTPHLSQRTPAIATTFARGYASETKAQPTEVSSILEQKIRGVQEDNSLAETGRVLTVG
jgi:hypothetical protein